VSALSDADRALVEAASDAIRKRYRYDWQEVGAALRTRSGKVFTGVSLDAYLGRMAVCAEAVALGQAITVAGEFGIETVVAVRHPPPEEKDGPPRFDAAGFFDQNLNFGGREFDVVLLWSTLDYIPQGLVEPLIEHLKQAVRKGGLILAIFHSKTTGPNTGFCRYHVTGTDAIEMQDAEPHPVQRVYTNRKIEELFSDFSNYRFFLAKDNLYEVLITR